MGGAAGFVFVFGMLIQNYALNEITAGRSGFLTALTVVFTPLLAFAITGRRPSVQVIAAVGIALYRPQPS